MQANPYAYALDGQDPRAVLAAAPGLIYNAACALSPEQLEAPIAPGKWSPRRMLAHLADTEIAFSLRLRQTLAPHAHEPEPTLQPFDQDAWAQHDAGYTVPAALSLLRSLRAWNLQLLSTVSAADAARTAYHPERGHLSFTQQLEMMAGHDLHHLKVLQALVPEGQNPTEQAQIS